MLATNVILPGLLLFGPSFGAVASPPITGAPTTAEPKTTGPQIYGGEPVAEGDFLSTAYVVVGNQACTGTVVSRKLVLTAAHCLVGPHQPEDILVAIGNEAVPGMITGATAFAPHPDYCDDCKEDVWDIGYIVLEGAVDGIEYPSFITSQKRYKDLMGEGEKVTLVGFGETDDLGSTATNPVKYAVNVPITGFTDSGNEFTAGGDGKDTCRGDSGGPAYLRTGSTLYLVGVTSRGTTECGGGGFYTAPLPALCWVRDETGIDLLDGSCSGCDCVDLSKTGCDCTTDDSGGGSALALVALVGLWRRRRLTQERRRPAPGPSQRR